MLTTQKHVHQLNRGDTVRCDGGALFVVTGTSRAAASSPSRLCVFMRPINSQLSYPFFFDTNEWAEVVDSEAEFLEHIDALGSYEVERAECDR